jgi:hypothetical protein
MELPRVRQLVLAAADLASVTAELEPALGISTPYRDPGVGHFGLHNAVYALGDCFVEVVSPTQPDTAAGRRLERAGGDCGYMVMFELADAEATRSRLADLSVRVVFESVHDDIVDLHLHPKDVPGAIVAVDVTTPPGSWRWGGPSWTAAVPPHGPGGLTGLTVAVSDPVAVAERWAAVIGVPEPPVDGVLRLAGGRQEVRFVPANGSTADGIVGAEVAVPPGTPTGIISVAGVDIDRRPSEEQA